MNNKLQPARRIRNLAPYLFKAIDDKKTALRATGKTLFNFGIGDPDLPTPEFVVAALATAAAQTANQKYPAYEGSSAFRQAVAQYMRSRFGVQLDADGQVTALIGSKEGIAHAAWAFLDDGDIALVPDPAYPVYATTARFAGAEPYLLPLHEDNGFFPDFSRIPSGIAERAKVLYLNYPNNPTGAVPSRTQLEQAVAFARQYGIIIIADAAYAELVYDPGDRLSLLTIPGAEEVTLEMHSFSKTLNMTGWRLGFAVGNTDLISGLLQLKTNVDSGAFDAIQLAGVAGLAQLERFLPDLIGEYRHRLDTLMEIMSANGFRFFRPRGSFYLWVNCPPGISSLDFTMQLMEQSGIVTTPGSGFGAAGEGYVRFALTQPVAVIQGAAKALAAFAKPR